MFMRFAGEERVVRVLAVSTTCDGDKPPCMRPLLRAAAVFPSEGVCDGDSVAAPAFSRGDARFASDALDDCDEDGPAVLRILRAFPLFFCEPSGEGGDVCVLKLEGERGGRGDADSASMGAAPSLSLSLLSRRVCPMICC
mmetsp:Transcript_44625/g.105722  ORF Transcript_44625/g.105722 Transcript_44625/m.105722 type:complete len:140 (+) Transcript_44625:177-596(+)